MLMTLPRLFMELNFYPYSLLLAVSLEVNKKRKTVGDAKYEELREQAERDKEASEASLQRHRERWSKKK
jgi:hypothetical protein